MQKSLGRSVTFLYVERPPREIRWVKQPCPAASNDAQQYDKRENLQNHITRPIWASPRNNLRVELRLRLHDQRCQISWWLGYTITLLRTHLRPPIGPRGVSVNSYFWLSTHLNGQNSIPLHHLVCGLTKLVRGRKAFDYSKANRSQPKDHLNPGCVNKRQFYSSLFRNTKKTWQLKTTLTDVLPVPRASTTSQLVSVSNIWFKEPQRKSCIRTV